MKILVIEASTSSAKAMVFDSAAGVLRVAESPYGGRCSTTLHDLRDVMTSVTTVAQQALAGEVVEGIALVSAWHGLVLTDEEMNPTTPVYLWSNMDAQQITDELRRDTDFVDRFYNRTGCMVNATYPIFELLHLAKSGTDTTKGRILDEGCYLNWLLTGKYVQTECLASGTGLLNLRTRTWDQELLTFAGISELQLPEVVNSRTTFPLSPQGAKLLGLPEGIPVVPTNSDGALNQVAAAESERNVMSFSVGTSGAMRMSVPSPKLAADHSTWCYISPDDWVSGVATAGAGNCVNWLRDVVARGQWDFPELEQMIDENSEPPIFLPFLFGERCPGWLDKRQGGFHGLLPGHGVADMYEAVREGILYNLKQCYLSMCELNGKPECIKISGGILKSASWSQMAADVVNMPLEIDRTLHSSMYGGAKNALRAIAGNSGEITTSPTVAEIITPRAAKVEVLERRYQRYLEKYRQGRSELTSASS